MPKPVDETMMQRLQELEDRIAALEADEPDSDDNLTDEDIAANDAAMADMEAAAENPQLPAPRKPMAAMASRKPGQSY